MLQKKLVKLLNVVRKLFGNCLKIVKKNNTKLVETKFGTLHRNYQTILVFMLAFVARQRLP